MVFPTDENVIVGLDRADDAGIMSNFNISACTDVTGFGLLGYLAEMVCGSGMSVRIFAKQVPVIAEALEFASMQLADKVISI